MELSHHLSDPATVVAVVGATDSPWKYGGRIYRDLKRKGFTVFPVNPHRVTVDGDQAFPDLASLPRRPDIVDVVVPSEIGAGVVAEAHRLGIEHVWLQPGAEGPEISSSDTDSPPIVGRCIMVETSSLR